MTGRRPAAAVDEEAELRALSDQAEKTRLALADTAAALAQAVSATVHPSVLARRAVRAARPGRRAVASARRAAVVAVPAAIVLAAATIYLLGRRAR